MLKILLITLKTLFYVLPRDVRLSATDVFFISVIITPATVFVGLSKFRVICAPPPFSYFAFTAELKTQR